MTQLLLELIAWLTMLTIRQIFGLGVIMNFSEYQQQAEDIFQIPPSLNNSLTYITWVLGVSAKAGELSWRISQLINENNGISDYKTNLQITEVMGFILWNMTQLASELQIDLDDIAVSSLQSLIKPNNP